jgi:hypothetical protein
MESTYLAAIRRAALLRAKAQIICDWIGGDGELFGEALPASFTELHDYVDANEYGGACEPDVAAAIAGALGIVPDEDEDLARAGDVGPFPERGDGFWRCVDLFWAPMQEELDLWIVRGGLREAVRLARAGHEGVDVPALRCLAAGLPVVDANVEELLG